jgi:hypothetical protein
MSGNIRLPNITGKTVEEQAQQMKSYLTQLAGELNWALDNMNGLSGGSGGYIPYRSANTGAGSSGTDVQKKAEELLQNFNDLKGLIIKSADIINAYYEEINKKLSGLYVAQSDYGAFVEKTEAITTENSKNTTTNYTNIQLVTNMVTTVQNDLGQNINNAKADLQCGIDKAKSDLADSIKDTEDDLDGKIAETKGNLEKSVADAKKELEDKLKEVDTYLVSVRATIKTGELYTDDNGIPIYGLEIGQTTEVNGVEIFNQFARLTASRLSFYDPNGYETAYISDKRLFIANVEITGSFTHGGFVDTPMADKSIVTKWIGGG